MNYDMYAVTNLEGRQYRLFVATSSVGIRDPTLRFSPKKLWLPVDMVIHGRERDKDGYMLLTWRKRFIRAARSCANKRIENDISCLEVEVRRVGSADLFVLLVFICSPKCFCIKLRIANRVATCVEFREMVNIFLRH